MRTRFNHIQQRISRMDAELSRAEDLLRQTIELDGQSVSDQAADTSVSVISQTQTPSHKTSMRTMKSSSTTNSTRTSRALNSVTQYLNPSSSQFLTKHSFRNLPPKSVLAKLNLILLLSLLARLLTIVSDLNHR